jgi:hypothetical protein
MHTNTIPSLLPRRAAVWLTAAACALLAACGGRDAEAPVITTAPVDQAVTAPAAATFSVAATGYPEPGLQWQVSTNGGTSWTDVAGATGSSHTTAATSGADDGQRYRVVASNVGGTATSTAARLSVTVPPPPPPPPSSSAVFTSDFDGTMPAQIDPGSATLTGVQGFAGYGPAGSVFGGQMLRSATANTVTITLTNLPAHSWLTLEFLLAAIDSLDGTGTFPAGDFLEVKVDGISIFNESFANSLVTQIQSYVPPAGGELARRVELGFWSAYPESAYWMGVEPKFQRIAHSASSVTITFRMEGSGETLDNESWGIDNLRVIVGND